jgi:hypothetical protein
VKPRFLLDEVEYPIERLPTSPSDRNLEIYQRYTAGERAVDLAQEHRMSWQRVYQIINQVRAYQLNRLAGGKDENAFVQPEAARGITAGR